MLDCNFGPLSVGVLPVCSPVGAVCLVLGLCVQVQSNAPPHGTAPEDELCEEDFEGMEDLDEADLAELEAGIADDING